MSRSLTQALYNNINISIFASLAVVPKHGLAIRTIKKSKKKGTVVVHKKLHACMGSTSTRCVAVTRSSLSTLLPTSGFLYHNLIDKQVCR